MGNGEEGMSETADLGDRQMLSEGHPSSLGHPAGSMGHLIP